MDPDVVLDDIFELAEQFEYESDPGILIGIAFELIEAFNQLDDWLTKGGFLPARWEKD